MKRVWYNETTVEPALTATPSNSQLPFTAKALAQFPININYIYIYQGGGQVGFH